MPSCRLQPEYDAGSPFSSTGALMSIGQCLLSLHVVARIAATTARLERTGPSRCDRNPLTAQRLLRNGNCLPAIRRRLQPDYIRTVTALRLDQHVFHYAGKAGTAGTRHVDVYQLAAVAESPVWARRYTACRKMRRHGGTCISCRGNPGVGWPPLFAWTQFRS